MLTMATGLSSPVLRLVGLIDMHLNQHSGCVEMPQILDEIQAPLNWKVVYQHVVLLWSMKLNQIWSVKIGRFFHVIQQLQLLCREAAKVLLVVPNCTASEAEMDHF